MNPFDEVRASIEANCRANTENPPEGFNFTPEHAVSKIETSTWRDSEVFCPHCGAQNLADLPMPQDPLLGGVKVLVECIDCEKHFVVGWVVVSTPTGSPKKK